MINKENLLGLLGLSSRAGKVISGTDACIEYINKNKIEVELPTSISISLRFHPSQQFAGVHATLIFSY